MFGYVTVPKAALTEYEYKIFCSYYCGVCKAVGKHASQFSRLGLSYDTAFLALVLSSLGDDGEIKASHCAVHPLKKRECIKNDSAVDYAAQTGVLLEYLKLSDDWHDDRSIKALLAMCGMLSGFRRSKAALPSQYGIIKEQLNALIALEKKGCRSIDEAADAFAKITQALFTPDFIECKSQRRTLGWLGYNIGRWIYIIDAFDDFEKDLKRGSYNPLIFSGKRNREQCVSETETSLVFTLENIASAFELTNFKRNRDLIGKIIYIGLKQKQEQILSGKENEKAK